jgi:hypothetical protein
MCTSHRPHGYPPFTLYSWQWTHGSPWCNSWHLCSHYARCWFLCGIKTTMCTSFNHIQFLSSTSWHCAHQIWCSHFSWHCYYQPNTNRFTSLILCNSRICHLRYISSQKKELSWPTPHWSIPLFNNWSIWMSTQINWVFTWLCQCHLELKKARKPSSFYLG